MSRRRSSPVSYTHLDVYKRQDPELRELAQEELSAAKAELERLTEELKRLLLPKDPNDDKNVILEIRAGIGGEEGALFAADLLRICLLYTSCW